MEQEEVESPPLPVHILLGSLGPHNIKILHLAALKTCLDLIGNVKQLHSRYLSESSVLTSFNIYF